MAIQAITYQKGFQISLTWPKGVQGTILYALPKGAQRPSDEEILAGLDNKLLLDQLSGFSYKSGIGQIQYSPTDGQLTARWIDIYYLDYDRDGFALAHELAGSYFNGDCKVGVSVQYTRVSDACQAVQITAQNLSSFEIEAGGIGYRVNARVFPIPLRLRQGQRLQLPQFEIPLDAVCEMHRFEDQYPARFLPLDA